MSQRPGLRPVFRRILAAAGAAAVAAAVLPAAALATSPSIRPAPAAAAAPGSAGAATTIRRFGVKPQHAQPGAARAASSNTLSVGSSASTGVVSPQPTVFLVFWGSQWSNDPARAADDLQRFFQGLSGSQDTWGTIMNQYCEGVPRGTTACGSAGIHIQHPGSSPLAGVWFDNAAPAPTNASAAQIAQEGVDAAGHFGNTSQTPNLNAQYVVVSASGTHPDGFPNSGFCAYHSSVSSSFGTVAFTNLPYIPDLGAGGCTTLGGGRLLDGLESTETHEYAEVLTDFFPSNGWNGGGGEIGDECTQLDSRLTLSTGTFDVQGLWSNDLNNCVTSETPAGGPPPPMGGPQPLTQQFGNRGTSDDGGAGQADFDGGGFSYSRRALDGAGLTQGAAVTVNGLHFTWPSASSGQPDNVQVSGQAVGVSGVRRLGFLGSATNGSASGTGTIRYTDGSTQSFTLRLTDWARSAQSGNRVVATMDHRNAGDGSADGITVFVFETDVRLRSGATVASVTLPASVSGGQLHVFAIAAG